MMNSIFNVPTGTRKPLAVAVALATLSSTSSVMAQETREKVSAAILDEIVVLAQKREQNIQEVPLAVTAMDARMLQAQGINEPKDLKNVIPNFSVGDYQGETKISIRGVGHLILSSNPGVAIHIDGVYQPRASMAGLNQVDMAGVEVLRGPQGTTYGRNANGGAVNYTTQSGGEEFGGYVLASFAEYDETRLQLGLDIPFSDSVRSRLTLDRTDRGEGFAENVGPGGDGMEGETLMARYRIDADLSDSVDGTLILTHAEVDGSFSMFDSLTPVSPAVASLSPFNQAFLTPPSADNLDPNAIAQNVTSQQEREYQAVSAILNWDINDTFDFKSITSFQSWEDLRVTDNDLTNADIVDARIEEEGDTFTQEFNLVYNTENSSGVIGAYYLDDELSGRQLLTFRNPISFGGVPFPIPPGSIVPSHWLPYTNTSTSVFADINYDLSENLSLIAGVRFAKEEIEIEQAGAFFFNLPFGLIPAGPPGAPPSPCAVAFLNGGTVTQNKIDYDVTTPRVGLRYAMSDNQNLYATYSEGFKSGGYQLRTGCGDDYDQETVKSIEIGSKNVFADGRVRLNATVFMYDYEGFQIDQLIGLAFSTANAEEAEVIGLELESTFVVNDNLSIIANASHQKSEFTKHSSADGLNPMLGVQDLSGNPLPGAPDTTVNLGVIYEMDNGLAFQLNAAYKSEINFREFNNPLDAQDSYTLLNANVRWANEDDSINLRLFANNLTDEDYIQSLFSSSLTGNRIGTWGAPRQVGIELRYKF